MRSTALALLLLLALSACACAQVTVVSSSPAAGAKDVDPSIAQLRVQFSAPVSTGGWSFVNTQYGEPVESTGKPVFSENNTVCTLPITLKPGITYSVSINSSKFQNFKSADGVPVTPYLIGFTTSGKREIKGPAEITVTRTYPENGAKNIDPKLNYIRVRFSAPVRTDGWSFPTTSLGSPIEVTGKPRFEDGGLLCILPIKLKPGTTYSVSVNSARHRNFKSAGDPSVTVTPYPITFSTSGQPTKATQKMTPAKWREDLAYLARELPARHKNLFFKISESQFRKQVSELDKRIPKLTEDQIMVGLMRLVASVGDEHTGIGGGSYSDLPNLPLAMYWFKDGVFVMSAAREYKSALGCRVTKIGSMSIENACAAVGELIAHRNEAQARKSAPFLLVSTVVLRGLGIAGRTGGVTLGFVDPTGKPKSLIVKPADAIASAGSEEAYDSTKHPLPLYRTNRIEPYWAEYVPEADLIYFAYNQCVDSPEKPFGTMRAEVDRLTNDHPSAKLVIDLRNNGGGNSSIMDPFIDSIKVNDSFAAKGKLFAVVGRRTFSSAILNANRLRSETSAILVGEPTGGSPNHYGEVQAFQLPNSGLNVSYSTKYFNHVEGDPSTINPDILAELTSADFLAGRDPAIDAIRAYGPQAK